jgi:hypothetical protein
MRDAVEPVLTTSRPIAEVAGELGMYGSTLGNQVRHRRGAGPRLDPVRARRSSLSPRSTVKEIGDRRPV